MENPVFVNEIDYEKENIRIYLEVNNNIDPKGEPFNL